MIATLVEPWATGSPPTERYEAGALKIIDDDVSSPRLVVQGR